MSGQVESVRSVNVLTITNQPGRAAHAGLTFLVYVVDEGERLRYSKEATRRTVEFYDARYPHFPNGSGEATSHGVRPERVGQFVADYHAETLLEDRERLAGGLNLYGGEASWTIDGAALAEVFAALD